jgi:uracil-DNA glycosylase family 4
MMLGHPSDDEPAADCPLCPRLTAFRAASRARQPTWHNAPVPGFGGADARLLVVGLAPGLQGANRTGRPFTGDFAGELLYQTLAAFRFAKGAYAAKPDDGLALVDCKITNAVRCVPPENKPTGAEIVTCRRFLVATIASMARLEVVVALGRIAHDSTLRALGASPSRFPFAHGAAYGVGRLLMLSSYHCSRYNTNTGKLTPEMFRTVFAAARRHLDGA